jgi:hypothetical protein
MRTYQLQPGKLLDWEASWRRGLEARRKFVVSYKSRLDALVIPSPLIAVLLPIKAKDLPCYEKSENERESRVEVLNDVSRCSAELNLVPCGCIFFSGRPATRSPPHLAIPVSIFPLRLIHLQDDLYLSLLPLPLSRPSHLRLWLLPSWLAIIFLVLSSPCSNQVSQGESFE